MQRPTLGIIPALRYVLKISVKLTRSAFAGIGLEKGQLDLVAGSRPAKGSPLMRLFVPMRIPATICSVNIYAMWMPFSRVQF